MIPTIVKEAIQVLQHLPYTARYTHEQRVGITQKQGPPIIGTVTNIGYTEGTVTVKREDDRGNLTAPASKTTLVF